MRFIYFRDKLHFLHRAQPLTQHLLRGGAPARWGQNPRRTSTAASKGSSKAWCEENATVPYASIPVGEIKKLFDRQGERIEGHDVRVCPRNVASIQPHLMKQTRWPSSTAR